MSRYIRHCAPMSRAKTLASGAYEPERNKNNAVIHCSLYLAAGIGSPHFPTWPRFYGCTGNSSVQRRRRLPFGLAYSVLYTNLVLADQAWYIRLLTPFLLALASRFLSNLSADERALGPLRLSNSAKCRLRRAC